MPRSLRQLFSSCAIVFLFIFFRAICFLPVPIDVPPTGEFRVEIGMPRQTANGSASGFPGTTSFRVIVTDDPDERELAADANDDSVDIFWTAARFVAERYYFTWIPNDLKNQRKKCFCLRKCHYSKVPQRNIYFIKNVWKKRSLTNLVIYNL